MDSFGSSETPSAWIKFSCLSRQRPSRISIWGDAAMKVCHHQIRSMRKNMTNQKNTCWTFVVSPTYTRKRTATIWLCHVHHGPLTLINQMTNCIRNLNTSLQVLMFQSTYGHKISRGDKSIVGIYSIIWILPRWVEHSPSSWTHKHL